MIRVFAAILRIVLPIVVVLLGGAGAYYLITTQPKPEKVSSGQEATLVEVLQAEKRVEPVIVDAHGTVMAEKQIEVRPEVSGQIVEQSNQLIPGGFFEKGDLIARIDERDYRYVLEQRKAEYERARFELKQEQGRKVVAEREWGLLGDEVPATDVGRELALREPQLNFAKANLEGKKSLVEDARLDLERTKITAPFNAFVKDEFVDIGQTVNPQSTIVTLYGTDHFWVRVSVPVEHLRWIRIPKKAGERGSPAYVLHQASGVEKKGYVLRLLGALEENGRMAQLLVQIDDPFGLQSETADEQAPLLVGSYVRVLIEGRKIEDVYVVPWYSIQEGNRVWIKNENNKLEIREVEIVWEREEDALVREGLNPGDEIITSRLPSVVPGMLLETASETDERLVQTPSDTVIDATESAQDVSRGVTQ